MWLFFKQIDVPIRIDEKGVVHVVHNKSKWCFVRLFEVAFLGVVHRDFTALLCLRVVGTNFRRGNKHVVWYFPTFVVYNHHVG